MVASLLNLALSAVVKDIQLYEDTLKCLPPHIKSKCLNIISKRGLLTDINLPQVIHANITSVDLSESDVSDVGLAALAMCRRLQKIDLNAVKGTRTNITYQGLSVLFQSCKMLRTVHLRRCTQVNDDCIEALSLNCPHLSSLNISGCSNVTDRGLQGLSVNCRTIQSLDLSRIKVTDDGIALLTDSHNAATLKEVNISNCCHISDVAVQCLVLSCPKISILVFHGCPMVTDKCRETVLTHHRLANFKQLTWTIY